MPAKFNSPTGIAVDDTGALYVADSGNNCIRMIREGKVSTVAGEGISGYFDGSSSSSWFKRPSDVAVGANGTIYVSDTENGRIRIIKDGHVTTLLGLDFVKPHGITTDLRGAVYVCESEYSCVFKIDGGSYSVIKPAVRTPRSVAAGSDGSVYICNSDKINVVRNGRASTILITYEKIGGVAVSRDGELFFTVDNAVRMIRKGEVSVLAGYFADGFLDGDASKALFDNPQGIAVDSNGTVYVADTGNHRIRMICNGQVSTIAGCSQSGFEDDVDFETASKSKKARPMLSDSSASLEKSLGIPTNASITINNRPVAFHSAFVKLRCPALLTPSSSRLQAAPVDARSIDLFERFLYSDLLPDELGLTQLLGLSHLLLVAGFLPHAHALLARLQEKEAQDVKELVQLYCYSLDLGPFEEGRQVALYLLRKHSNDLKSHMKDLPSWLGKHGLGPALVDFVWELVGPLDPSQGPIAATALAKKWNCLSVSETLEKLYDDRSSSGDFEIVIPGRAKAKSVVHTVHSFVLHVRWPYFRRMYDANMKEKHQGRLVLPSSNEDGAMSPEVLQLVIEFCYKPNMMRDKAKKTAISLLTAIQLLSIADLYFFDSANDPAADVWKNLLNSARITIGKALQVNQESNQSEIQSLPGPILYELLLAAVSMISD